jgi:hypothetical protein
MKCHICGESDWVDINTGFYYSDATLIFSEKNEISTTLACLNCNAKRIIILNKFLKEKLIETGKEITTNKLYNSFVTQ